MQIWAEEVDEKVVLGRPVQMIYDDQTDVRTSPQSMPSSSIWAK